MDKELTSDEEVTQYLTSGSENRIALILFLLARRSFSSSWKKWYLLVCWKIAQLRSSRCDFADLTVYKQLPYVQSNHDHDSA